MKISVLGIAFAAILTATANAQIATTDAKKSTSLFTIREDGLKKADFATGNSPLSTTRASRDFSSRFKNAGNAKWYEMKNGLIAKFDENGKAIKAFYDRNGRWFYTIATYGESKLPVDVRKQVKSVYYDYTIDVVIEVNVDDKTAYLVKMEDEKTLKTIRVVDGEMDVYEDYLKGY
ncbi:MAG: hypothetical protein QM764_20305 [Chitinophagaceae bacterium]